MLRAAVDEVEDHGFDAAVLAVDQLTDEDAAG